MRKHALLLRAVSFRTLIIAGCLFYAASSQAQSIVGKWKLTDAKETITDKASGQTQDIGAQMQEMLKRMQQTLMFNADNTYSFSTSMVGAKNGIEVNGTYSISGNELKLSEGNSNIPKPDSKYSAGSPTKLPPTATIVSQTANTLVLHYGTELTRDGKTFVISIDDTFTKQ